MYGRQSTVERERIVLNSTMAAEFSAEILLAINQLNQLKCPHSASRAWEVQFYYEPRNRRTGILVNSMLSAYPNHTEHEVGCFFFLSFDFHKKIKVSFLKPKNF